MAENKFIQKIGLKKGALHKQLGIPEGEKIPLKVLEKAAKAKGKLGQRARFALTLRKLVKRKRKKKK
jgi:lipopolysaccharide export system protein LptA